MSSAPQIHVDDRRVPVPLAVAIIDRGHEVVGFVNGEADRATCGDLRTALAPYVRRNQRVALDLSGVTFMDSSCLGVLREARMQLADAGGSLVLRNPSKASHRLIAAAGLTQVFAVEIG